MAAADIAAGLPSANRLAMMWRAFSAVTDTPKRG
jgi:hypothetical protein